MFISKRKYQSITKRLAALERQSATHAEFLHRDYERLDNYFEAIKKIKENIGSPAPSTEDSVLSHFINGYLGLPGGASARIKTKQLTLNEKIDQMMDHVGLVVKHTSASVKLAKKPEPKPKAPAKKTGKK